MINLHNVIFLHCFNHFEVKSSVVLSTLTVLCNHYPFPELSHGKLYTFNSNCQFFSPSCLWNSLTYFLSVWICLFYIRYISGSIDVCPIWLILLSTMFSKSIHVTRVRMSFFWKLNNVPLYIIDIFVYPFYLFMGICVFPLFDSREWYCSEHSCHMNLDFQLFWVYRPSSRTIDSRDDSVYHLEELLYYFPEWLHGPFKKY